MRRLRASAGFTLLEILVVVTIIALLAGAAVMSMGVLGSDREIEREVFRLRTLVNLVREEALMQSRDFALLFAEDGYRFYTYDYQQLRWVEPTDDRLLAERALEGPLRVELLVEDRDVILEPEIALAGRDDEGFSDGDDDEEDENDEGDGPQPHVMILSSGEMTPFEAGFYRILNCRAFDAACLREEQAARRFVLSGELDGSLGVAEVGFETP